MVYRDGLENHWAERSRGFESLPLRQFSRIKNLGFLGACYQYPDTLAATTDHATQTGRHSVPGSPLSKANSPTSPSNSMIALVR